MLQYAYGAQSVKCAVCNHVTPTDPSSHPSAAGMARQGSTAAQNPPKPPTQTVVVENPATLDEQGNVVPPPPPRVLPTPRNLVWALSHHQPLHRYAKLCRLTLCAGTI